MKKIFLGSAWQAIATACLFSISADALALSASATLTDLQFTISDLKADGIPASFSFGTGTSNAQISHVLSPTVADSKSESNPGEFLATSLGLNHEFRTTQFDSNAEIGADSLKVFVYSTKLPIDFLAQASVTDTTKPLTIAPYTKVTITATGHLQLDLSEHAASTYQNQYFYVQAALAVRGDDIFGQDSANAWIYPSIYPNDTNQSIYLTQTIKLTLVNNSDKAVSGFFFASANVQGHTLGAPVPEPEALAMAFAGLAAMGLTAARRRRAVKRASAAA